MTKKTKAIADPRVSAMLSKFKERAAGIEAFKAAGEAAFGEQWQSELAYAIGANPRTIRRYVAGELSISPLVWANVREVLRARRKAIVAAARAQGLAIAAALEALPRE
jgi:methylphosphotriester-DNA--protein-cysteine methyltransferase